VRRRVAVIGFGVAMAVLWAQPALAAQDVRIRGVDPKQFPLVTVTVSVQQSVSLFPGQVRVSENGIPVDVTTVRSAGPSRGVGVVLAIDTSDSMKGLPLQTAYAAAREFVSKVPSWMHIGLVTFADQPQPVQDLNSDHNTLLGSLATTPPTASGTALYDGIVTASGMFEGPGQRNIILLTDGRNTTGAVGLRGAVAAARSARATIFTVALEGANSDESTLQQLAKLTGGSFLSASPQDLDAAYRTLARQLSRQYLITYKSKVPFGAEATVTVDLPEGSGTYGFLAPGPHAAASTNLSALARFFRGPLGAASAVGLSFFAALGLFSLLLGAQVRAGRQRILEQRIPALPKPQANVGASPSASPLTSWIPESVVGAAGRVATYTGLAATLDARLERAGLAMRPGEFLAGMSLSALVGGVVGGVVGRLVSQVLPGVLLFALAGAILPWAALSSMAHRRIRQLQRQLPDVLMVIASSLRAGHSFLQALDMVTKEVGEPSSHEYLRAVTEIRLGRPVDETLIAMAGRFGSDDFEWAVMAINIQRQVGGNLAELLETVAGTVRERETLRRQVRVLSGEGRLSVIILTVLPLLLATYILLVVPSYIQSLFHTPIGIMLLLGAGLLMIIGHTWMRRITKLDV
jgi:tight adherence protein B